MQNANISILRKFVMEYGSILGLCWVVVFTSYVAAFRMQNAFFMLTGLCGLLALLLLEFFFGIRIKKRSLQLNLRLSPLFTYMNVLSMFMYACLLSGCMEYIYFAYIDKGQLIDSILSMVTTAEIETLYRQMGMSESHQQITDMIQELSLLTPFDKTMMLFNQNFFFTLIISIPVAAVAYFSKPAIQK